jgi:hypothetical protein
MGNKIPIEEAKYISTNYEYDQVIIYAREVGKNGVEWVTTYGIDKEHCHAAAKIGDALRGQVIQPLEEQAEEIEKLRLEIEELKSKIEEYYGN